jgi:Flp pilus assembly protein CpaB
VAIQANKPNSRIFLLLGVVLAAAAAIAVLLLVRSNAPANEVGVVVADSNIPAGTTLTPAMVIVTQVPLTAKPGDAYVDPVAVVGKVTTVAIADNTPLVPGFFSTPSLVTSSGSGSTALSVETQITKGYVAIAIPTSSQVPSLFVPAATANVSGELVSAGFYILPGDHLDILVDTGVGQGGVRYSFQDVVVLRVGISGSTSTTNPGVIVVEVPRSQAELMTALTANVGDHSFVLRYVLRPQSEWGKLAPDGTKYTPNYEGSGAPTLPSVPDATVTPGTLDSLFGH